MVILSVIILPFFHSSHKIITNNWSFEKLTNLNQRDEEDVSHINTTLIISKDKASDLTYSYKNVTKEKRNINLQQI